jgi:hypothetical protein
MDIGSGQKDIAGYEPTASSGDPIGEQKADTSSFECFLYTSIAILAYIFFFYLLLRLSRYASIFFIFSCLLDK